MFEHAYLPVIKKPTRITSTNATLLDHIWTNVILSQSIKAGILTYEISDHLPVLLSLRLSSYSQAPGLKYRRCFSDTNISKFNASVESLDITAVLNESDPNLSFKLFMSLYNTEFNNHFPLVRVKETKSFAPWFDTELQALLSKKEKLFKIYMHQKTSHTKEAFTKIRNYYFRCVRIKKQEYYRTKFAKYKSDIRSTWRSINFLLGKAKSNECSSLKIQDNLNDLAEIANNFNNHFATAAANLTSSLPFSNSHFSNYLGPVAKIRCLCGRRLHTRLKT